MNKHLYRVVFNQARGLFQVAAEITRRHGGIGSGNHDAVATSHTIHATLTPLRFALLLILGQVTVISTSQAQIVADPNAPGNQRPTVLEAANGVPLVNIQTPSAAGVSRNTYQQFDINAPGVILNNARTNAQTQIGGWVQGNPWLAKGTARVILNEVNSNNPSQLRGMVEIAGNRAELVIANPAGIACDGCGFINADRTTLTTGTPVMHGGFLESYRVQRGTIAIDGKGMDASANDYTALIARSVQVNASLWAQQLEVTTGAQEVSAADGSVKPMPADGSRPVFALDVSALGGMYAQKIVLVGTEHGVGARNAGHIGAQAGELIVTADGRLENIGTMQAAADARIAVQDVENTGVINADTLTVQAQTLNNTDGVLYAEKTLTANVSDTVNNQRGLMLADQDVTITARQVLNRDTADANQGIQAERLRITAHGVENVKGTIAADRHVAIRGTGDNSQLNNSEGTISSKGEIAVTVQRIQNTNGTLLAEHKLDVDADSLSGDGRLLSRGDLRLTLKEDFTNDGEVTANGQANVRTAGTLRNHSVMQAGDLAVTASAINNTETGVVRGNRTTIQARDALENRGVIDGAATHIEADTVDNIGTGRIYGDHVSIAANTVTNHEEDEHAAVIAARERLGIGADTLINREQALIFSAGTGSNALNIGGSLDADNHATGQATLVRNDSATMESLGGLSISSQYLYNTNLHFDTALVQVAGPQRYLYIQPQGDPEKHNVDEYQWENWSRAGRYRHKETGQEIRNWTQYDFVQTDYETQVTESSPALIRSGSDMTLLGESLVNDKSQIIAGGVLQGDLDKLENIDGTGDYVIHQEGTSQYTRSRWRGGFKQYFQRRWDAPIAYTPADDVRTITLNVVKTEQHANIGASSYAVANRQALDQVGNVRTLQIHVSIPANSLFRVNASGAPAYLIETDPRFTNYRQWLSSDYMLTALGYDPIHVQKRLGDGFYEQQLIRDQIGQLTGRRFLDGYADDEVQYRALLNAGATFAHDWNLRPGVALTAEQMAQLTSDVVWLVEREVTLPDSTTTTALVPQVYVQVKPGDLDGRGTLLAADRVELNLNSDLINSATIAGRTAVRLTGENLRNLGGRISADAVALAARTDIDNIGGTVDAQSTLLLSAGRDLNVTTTTHSDAKTAGLSDFSRTNIDRVAGLYVTDPNGILQAVAARDVNLAGAHIANSGVNGKTVIAAGRDLNLATIQIAEQENNVRNADNYLRQGYVQDIGTTIQTAGDIALQAGNNLNATAANIESKTGAIQAAAGDINIQAGQIDSNWSEGRKHKDRSTLGSKQTTTRESLNQTRALASTFSGDTVAIQGQNVTITGSNVVSDTGTVLVAQNNLTIQAATETQSESHFKEVKKSGVLYNGGAAVTIGKQSQSLDKQDLSTHAAASTIGSTQGDVALIAGNAYQQTGSRVMAPQGDVDIHAKTVNIEETRETRDSVQEQKFRQSGLTVALSNPVLSAIQTGQQMASAASQTSDARMQALAGATTALTAKNAYDAVQANPGTLGGLNLSVTLGSSKSQSQSTVASDTAAGSTITAGGDVRISVTGAGENSNLTVRGSDITANGDVHLQADGNVNLLAAQNTVEMQRKSSSSSAGAGVAVNFGENGMAVGLTANTSRGKGKGEGSDVTWSNTHVSAGEQLTIESGADTTLRGAVVRGQQVAMDVGGNLNLESLQDISVFHSKDTSVGGSITVGTGLAGSASYSKTKVDGDFASVHEQSGIQAGDGGFQVNVTGNTDLKGAVIASTNQAVQDNLNHISTGTLTASNIENHSEYSANSVSLSGGFSVGGGDKKADKNTNEAANGNEASNAPETSPASNVADKGSEWSWQNFGNSASAGAPGRSTESGSASSTTRSGISGATIEIRDQDAQQALTGKSAEDTLASLNRDVLTGDDANGLSKDWDPEKLATKMKAQAEITAAFSQQAYAQVEKYVQAERAELQKRLEQAQTPEDERALNAALKELELQERAMNVLIGAVTGNGVSAVTKETLSAAASEMRRLMIEDSEKFPGIVDENGYVLSNISGKSSGVRGDGKKLGGTRIDLDIICGSPNERCKTNPDGSLQLDSQGRVKFDNEKAKMGLASFLETEKGKQAIGLTGGIQGGDGTLFGISYPPDSWMDHLVEAFSGTHDMIGGKLSGLYDEKGNATQGRSKLTSTTQNIWSGVAIIPATPFAMSELLPAEVWQAISVFINSAK